MCKQLGFITALPSDIVIEIFAHLSQQDSLTCMAVCRDWYSIVPQYAQDVWKELRLSERDASSNHRRRDQCLGSHVKSVTIKPTRKSKRVNEKVLHAIMIKLLQWGCTEIKSFEFISCYVSDQKELILLLKELSPQLTRLSLSIPSSKCDILLFLVAFPELTHFTCQCIVSFGLITSQEPVTIVQHATLPTDFSTKLKFLWLDIDNMNKSDKQDLLRRSPDLRCLIDDYDDISTYLDSLVSWCPKLVCVEANSCSRFESQRGDHSVYVNTSTSGLRYINMYNRSYPDQVARQMVKNQDTLEFLSICNDRHGYDWTRTPGLIHFSNLRTLIIVHNQFTAESLVAMLNCCSLLETLKLQPRHNVIILDPAALLPLRKMHKLRSLNCDGITFSRDLSLLTFLEWFPALETLYIPVLYLSPSPPSDFEYPRKLKHVELPDIVWEFDGINSDKNAKVARFFECLLGRSKPEIIMLYEVPAVGYESLLMLAAIPTLKCLDVQLDRTVEEKDLLQFAKILGESTVIERLTIRCLANLSFSMFDALSGIHTLTYLSTEAGVSSYSPTHVSKDGLLHILRKSSSLISITFNGELDVRDEQGQKLEACHIAELVRQQTPYRKIPSARSKYWNMWGFLFNNQKQLRNIAIQLVDSS